MHHTKGVFCQRRVTHVCKQRLEGANASAHDLSISKPQSANGTCHQRDHLDVARSVAFADKLETQLRKLTGAAGTAHLLAHDRSLIAQAKRQIGRAHARRDQAYDGKRVVGAHHEQAAVIIEQLERRVRDATALFERTLILENRSLDRKIMVLLKAALHRLCDLLARLSLLGQNVPESPRCGRHTRAHPLYDSQTYRKKTRPQPVSGTLAY